MKTRGPRELNQAVMATDQVHSWLPSEARLLCPRRCSAGPGRRAHSQALQLSLPWGLGGSEMSGRAQILQPTVNPCSFGGPVISGRRAPGARSLMETPVCAHGLGASTCSQGHSTCLGSAGDHTQGPPWAGLNWLIIPSGDWKFSSSVLFLIYGVIISNSLPIYEKHE